MRTRAGIAVSRFAVLLTVMTAIGLPAAVYAQTDAPAILEVLPHSWQSILLTPETPRASVPWVIDAASRADVIVTSPSDQLDVVLISPHGMRYVIGQRRPDFESFVSVHEALGANYRALLTDPVRGTWTLEVRARKLEAALPVVVNTFLHSEVFVALAAGDAEHRVGATAALSLGAFDGSARLHDLQVSASVNGPATAPSAVVFRDDGMGGDVEARDGTYTAYVQLPAEGEYDIRAKVRGVARGGSFERTAAASVRAVRPRATLAGFFSDGGFDADGDGFLDRITVAPALSVIEPGAYSLSVRLRAASGATLQRSEQFDLTAGPASPEVRFSVDSVRDALGDDGPYQVEVILLERWTNGDREFVDRRLEAGLTQPYRLVDLQRPRTRILAPGSILGVDDDGNGLFDLLRVDLDLDIDLPGLYSVTARLIDTQFADRPSVPVTQTFPAGRSTARFDFPGEWVGAAGIDGPYALGISVLGPSDAAFAEGSFLTPAFLGAQFERNADPDIAPPQLTVSVVPRVIWPPNGQMVEIHTQLAASDDRDPAPVVTLVSITVHEGSDRLSDEEASSDVHLDGDRIFLRAIRRGNEQGRVYTLLWSATDASGNVSTKSVTVHVPHDQS